MWMHSPNSVTILAQYLHTSVARCTARARQSSEAAQNLVWQPCRTLHAPWTLLERPESQDASACRVPTTHIRHATVAWGSAVDCAQNLTEHGTVFIGVLCCPMLGVCSCIDPRGQHHYGTTTHIRRGCAYTMRCDHPRAF